MLIAIPGVVLGFAALSVYRSTFAERASRFNLHMAAGTLGLGLLAASYFVLITTATRLQDPEKWYRLKNLAILLLNWNAIWKFLFFMHLSMAVTGAGILFFFFRWTKRGLSGDEEYATFARKFGAGLGLAFCFAVPVFNLFYVFTSADVVFDNATYLLATVITLVCMVIAYAFIAALRARRPRFGATVFGMFIVVFVLSNTFDLRAMANANREHAEALGQASEKKKMEREAEIEQAVAAAGGANLGEETFKNVCMQCHRFNEKLVGPPLATVLPKYKDNPAALRAFISNPTKKNPDYPPMPNPGLTPGQVTAVAEYELSHYEQESGASQPAPGTQPTTQTEVPSGQKNH
jgi:cytochrome c